MSEEGIDMERCMQGVDDEAAWIPKINWVNCAEQMPPDDDSLIIVKISYIKPGVDYVYVGLISNYLAVTSKAFLDMLGRYAEAESKHWTLYNQEK